jgi:hypothetical protein
MSGAVDAIVTLPNDPKCDAVRSVCYFRKYSKLYFEWLGAVCHELRSG